MNITVHDLTFRPLITADEIAAAVARVGQEITKDYEGKTVLMLPILKGSFMFSADLARAIDLTQEFRFVLLSTYGDDTSSSQSVKKVEGLDGLDLTGQEVLIIEDIVDTGFSIEFLREELISRGAASVKVVAMFFKPDAFQGQEPPEYYGLSIPNEFVIGYGLDYAQRGRELGSVYVKV